MEIKETPFKGLYEIQPTVLRDDRGYFFESYHQKKLSQSGIDARFVQDNQSFSPKGVLRGLHFQRPPFDQGKLVRTIIGKALDVVVDLRQGSPTFGQHYKLVLDADKFNMLYVPPGFAHGFLALSDCVFFYKCTNFYDKASDGGIRWNDPDLAIDWGVAEANISAKDLQLPLLSEFLAGNNPWVF
ncbi:MAG: dTDP-4-dehydrorhamnose 3,5-epimerase [Cyclobacteriaceae bacterium]|nr:dTDP-4-dehydrorhamnose 3,5-epimerase [Cyclobacteriaceae bacterium]